jgi:hypothetical protein
LLLIFIFLFACVDALSHRRSHRLKLVCFSVNSSYRFIDLWALPPSDRKLVVPLVSQELVTDFHHFAIGDEPCGIDLENWTVKLGLFVLRNCRVEWHGEILTHNADVSERENFQVCRGIFQSVIGTSHFLSHQFYHSLHDMVFPISLIPESIVSVSWFVIGALLPPVREALSLFGLADRTVVLSSGEYVIARNLYVMEDMPDPFYVWSMRRAFRALAVRRWGLDAVAPSGVGVLNRPAGTKRHILDLANRTDAWRRHWPDLVWEYRILFPNLRTGAYWFNVRRAVIAATGAGCVHAVFMQKGSCFAELQSVVCFGFFVRLAASVGLDYVVMKIKGMDHWVPSNAVMGEKRARELAEFIVQRYFAKSWGGV